MNDNSRTPGTSRESREERELTDRREFVKKAGKVAITVPAVALLLSMKAQSAHAAVGSHLG